MVAVETFECSETAAEPIEASEEAISIMESLGLEAQLSLCTKTETGHATRCPYREITSEEQFVYTVLCPSSVKVERYSAAPIPLRVLQILSHAKSLGLFKQFCVWDRESVTVKDPVLVAFDNDNEWARSRKCFILARWGDELETFATLLKRAVEKKKQQLLDQINAVKSRIDADVANVMGMSSEQIINAGATAKVEVTIPGQR